MDLNQIRSNNNSSGNAPAQNNGFTGESANTGSGGAIPQQPQSQQPHQPQQQQQQQQGQQQQQQQQQGGNGNGSGSRRPRGRPNPRPRQPHAENGGETVNNINRVSKDTSPRSLAGMLSRVARQRNGTPSTLTMIGPAACNQAVKAVAIAQQQFLEEDQLDLTFQPMFVDIEEGEHRSGLQFLVQSADRKPPASATTDANGQEILCLKVASQTVPKNLAGALANRFRDGGLQINMTAIGPGSVNQAVKALAIAREYLSKDNLDIYCRPKFMDVERAGREETSSCIMLEVYPQPRK